MKTLRLIISVLLFAVVFFLGCRKENINAITDFEELDRLIANEEILKYDMRLYEECSEGHIANFMCFGLDIVEDYQVKIEKLVKSILLSYPNKTKKIVVITDDDDYALLMLQALEKEGYTALYYYKGGYHQYVNDKQGDFVPEKGCNCE